MLTYYVIYRNDEKNSPRGLFIMDTRRGGALLWDHRQGAWSYDPALVVRFLDDYRNLDRYVSVPRSDAEGVVGEITGGEHLPEENALESMIEDGLQRGSGL
ncbi:hypothetical protein [Micromonospora sp. NPDC049799]|uniref:hypothetical protein n=1 Tax=Micromonospora sp. NPDC049799 TaxID=3154741 RepID=UPI0033C03108